jgi:LysR family hydrogen peroxide-inducible transcriptional activator
MSTEPIFDPKATTLPVLRYLVALADHLHFGRAAAAAHISQPTMSSLIRQWEKTMHCQVFERDSHGVRVTPAGEQVIAAARAALQAMQAVEQAAAKSKPPFFGPVRLGVIPTVGPYALPFIVGALEKKFSTLELPIREDTTAHLMEALDGGRIDVALVAQLDGMDRRYVVEALFDEPFLVALSRKHRLARHKHIHVDDLIDERLLLLDEGHCLRDQALAMCQRRADSGVGADYRATSLETLRQIVASGAGITILPALASDNNDDRLVMKALEGDRAFRTIALVWRTSDPRADAYRQFVLAIKRDLPTDRIKSR